MITIYVNGLVRQSTLSIVSTVNFYKAVATYSPAVLSNPNAPEGITLQFFGRTVDGEQVILRVFSLPAGYKEHSPEKVLELLRLFGFTPPSDNILTKSLSSSTKKSKTVVFTR